MRYLTSALLCEGATDERFLPPLLTRTLEDLCRANFDQEVEVARVQPLRKKGGPRPIPEMISLVEENSGYFSIVYFHHDQGAHRQQVERDWLDPLRAAWGSRRELMIEVVPVRETEAWLLADGEAIRSALGVAWTDDGMGLPSAPKLVEHIADPKDVLNRVVRYDAVFLTMVSCKHLPASPRGRITQARLVAVRARPLLAAQDNLDPNNRLISPAEIAEFEVSQAPEAWSGSPG